MKVELPASTHGRGSDSDPQKWTICREKRMVQSDGCGVGKGRCVRRWTEHNHHPEWVHVHRGMGRGEGEGETGSHQKARHRQTDE